MLGLDAKTDIVVNAADMRRGGSPNKTVRRSYPGDQMSGEGGRKSDCPGLPLKFCFMTTCRHFWPRVRDGGYTICFVKSTPEISS